MAALRLDLTDPIISGNKWYKLAPALHKALQEGAAGFISLGGPHSNHLHALAAAGQRAGLATVGLLRGTVRSTPTVRDLAAFGMEMHWLGYGGYRARHADGFWEPWKARYPGFVCVPEGGGDLAGAQGCAKLVAQVQAAVAGLGWSDFDAWWLAAGTGTTLAGLAIGERGQRPVYGALAGPLTHGVDAHVRMLLAQADVCAARVELVEACRLGFGRLDDELLRFLAQTEQATGMPLEPVYTAKALMALHEQIQAGRFARGTRLVFVHTGGLQGKRALQHQTDHLEG